MLNLSTKNEQFTVRQPGFPRFSPRRSVCCRRRVRASERWAVRSVERLTCRDSGDRTGPQENVGEGMPRCRAHLPLRQRLVPTIWSGFRSCGDHSRRRPVQPVDQAEDANEDFPRQRRLVDLPKRRDLAHGFAQWGVERRDHPLHIEVV
jgi:hypothetical protein